MFSWLDCIDKKPIEIGVNKDAYVLIPKEFGGGKIIEKKYEGDGIFENKDIYELIAEWNRKYISEHPEFVIHEVRKVSDTSWYEQYSNLDLDPENFRNNKVSFRDVGIALDLYCKHKIPFPAKITYHSDLSYELCDYSKNDPDQGMPVEIKKHCMVCYKRRWNVEKRNLKVIYLDNKGKEYGEGEISVDICDRCREKIAKGAKLRLSGGEEQQILSLDGVIEEEDWVEENG